MGMCDSPFIKMIFPACSMVENRRALQAAGVIVVGIIILIILWIGGWQTWTSFIAVSVITGAAAFAAHYFDPAGRIAVNVAAPGVGNVAYQLATTAEETVQE